MDTIRNSPQAMAKAGRQRKPVSEMVRAHFGDLVPYVPVIPTDVLSKTEGLSEERIIKLDGNENPYGPSPRALEALRSFDGYHIYPDPEQRELRAKLGDYVGVASEHIIPGNGSDEIIDLAMRLFLEPGERVLNASPSFGMYPFNTHVCAAELVDIPRRADYTLDIDGLVAAAEDPRVKLAFVASPNNPTGNLLSPGDLERLLATGVIVVVDEAYQEFADAPSFVGWAPQYENLIVLRTFSKWAGLAGLRVGYGVMTPALVRVLDRVKPPYNVNVAALVAAAASLDDRPFILERVRLLIAERVRLMAQLQAVPWLDPLPSQANFILCKVHGKDAGAVKRGMERQGIFIKHLDTPLLPNALRFSVGKPEHTDAVMAALKTY